MSENDSFIEIDTLLNQLNGLNIGHAQRAIERLRTILNTQHGTIRNLNERIHEREETVRELRNNITRKDELITTLQNNNRELEERINDLNRRNNDLLSEINTRLRSHSDNFNTINQRLSAITDNPNQSIQIQEIREIREQINNLRNNNENNLTDIRERLDRIYNGIDNTIPIRLDSLFDLNRNHDEKLVLTNENLNEIRSQITSRVQFYYEPNVIRNQFREFFPSGDKLIIFFSFLIFLIGMFYCLCGNGKRDYCEKPNKCMIQC
jgi:chromosome segregation ATPase